MPSTTSPRATPKSENILVRIEPDLKEEATAFLDGLGLGMSVTQVVAVDGLPFDVRRKAR